MRWLQQGVWTGEGGFEGEPQNVQNNKKRLEVESAVAGDHTPMLKSAT